MCTVTWWREEEGAYGIFFNRDESRVRPRSLPVEQSVTRQGTRLLAPRDPQAGGTWLMVNEHGLAAGVLNHYEAAERYPPGRRSRGTIPIGVADCRDVDAALRTVAEIRKADFAPFIFMAWDRKREAARMWDGEGFEELASLVPPIATSSYRTGEVLAWRQQRYAELISRGPGSGPAVLKDVLSSYHHDNSHPDGSFNVRMRRADARTESICRVTVTAREIRYVHDLEADAPASEVDAHEARIALA